jgi:hypothetical protein
MSFPMPPGSSMGALGTAAAIQSPFEQTILGINSNPYFIGTMMLFLNLGGRFIALEMSKGQEQFFQNIWVRRFLLFTVVFVGTRNVIVAFWMSLIIILLLGYLFNENSDLCIYGKSPIPTVSSMSLSPPVSSMPVPPSVSQGPLTVDEKEILRRLQEKQMRGSSELMGAPAIKAPVKKPSDIYWENMNYLRGAEGFANPRF